MKLLNSLLIAITIWIIIPSTVFAQPADSPWPVFNGNNRHTGLSQYEIGTDRKELLWSYKTDLSVESSPVIGTDGTIYIGSHDGYLYALNSSGTLKWKFEVAKPVYDERWNVSKAIMATPAIDKNGTVYINGSSNYLHAIGSDGKEKWRFFTKWGNDFWNSPTIGNDGIIYIGTARNDGNTGNPAGLYAISPDGKEKWRYLEPSGVTVVPAVGSDGTIYFGAAETSTNKGRIVALTSDGKKKWQYDMEQWLEGSASIGADGTIYSGSKEGYIYAVNPDGTEKWRFKTGSGVSATPSIGPDGRIYIGSWDGNLYALNPKNGKELWRFDVKPGRDPKLFEGYPGKETICSSATISKDGVLVFADVFDTVYGVDTKGKELWRWKSESGSGFVSSPSISKDGTIYIGDEGGYFYALGNKKVTKPQANRSGGQQNKNVKLLLIIAIPYLFITVSALISAGIIYAIYRRIKKDNESEKKKLNIKILLIILLTALVIIAIAGALIFLFYPFKQDSETKDSKPKPIEKVETVQYEDEFTKNAIRILGPVDIWVREFGETGRSCLGEVCGALKDTCVRWNKNKDNCYEMIKTSPASSDRYKIYCNVVVVNQDNEKPADISLNLNYTTADGVKHLVKNESFRLATGSGQSLLWTYEVAADNIGKCEYSDIKVTKATN